MNYYEKIVILDPNLEDNAVDETVERIKDLIVRHGGEIFKTEKWGRRKLAYELNKHQKGNYILLLFKSPPSTILELEKLSKVVDPIIKFMVVKLTNKKQIAAIAQSATETAAKEAAVEETTTAPEKPAEAGEVAPPQEEMKNV
ncbi:MAG TPA: 30S ribosomal protein S6 [Nitrospirae bacterium]|nr:30S ribosomal protein S6 [bacterium BMS3Abin06]HDH12702.1 30S ribosomal protein S6 [Nitrospirota bacterium]HDZ00011.1 30S ribosomal protein S6 [Nitrospirota bacterium]